MNDIVMKSSENEYNDTGLTRNCPNCDARIEYKNKYRLSYAIRDNTWCNKCWRFKRKNTTSSEFFKQCPSCNKIVYFKTKYWLQRSIQNNAVCHSCADRGNNGRVQSVEEKEKRALKLRGQRRSLEIRRRYSSCKQGSGNYWFGKHIPKSVEHKRKIRLSCIKHVEDKLNLVGKQMSPTFNPEACAAIDEYGRQYGYNFQHALNGGEYRIKELGYWVDGYDRQKNAVIEYFENNHWHRKNKKKDLDRCAEICDYLGCKLIILREGVGGIYLPEHFR